MANPHLESRDQPFGLEPDPYFFYFDQRRRHIFDRVFVHGQDRTAIQLMLGEPGIGKTTMLRRIAEDARAVADTVQLRSCQQPTAIEALIDSWRRGAAVDGSASLPGSEASPRIGSDRQRSSETRPAFILFDEVDRLTESLLEELAWFLADRRAQEAPLSVVLAASSAVPERLPTSRSQSLCSLVDATFLLERLAADDTAPYIHHRLKMAGVDSAELFSRSAINRIAKHADGVPLTINRICASALLISRSENTPRVTATQVEQAVAAIGNENQQDSSTGNAAPRGHLDSPPGPAIDRTGGMVFFRDEKLSAVFGENTARQPADLTHDDTMSGNHPMPKVEPPIGHPLEIAQQDADVDSELIYLANAPATRSRTRMVLLIVGAIVVGGGATALYMQANREAEVSGASEPAETVALNAYSTAAGTPLKASQPRPRWEDPILPTSDRGRLSLTLGDDSREPAEPIAAEALAQVPEQARPVVVDGDAAGIPVSSSLDTRQLMIRGDTFMGLNDVVSARLFYRAAADKGSAHGATATGSTFDPLFLDQLRISAVHAKPAQAIEWYRRADAMGDPQAAIRLRDLTARLQRAASSGDEEAERVLQQLK